MTISYFIPAFNCAPTVAASVASILEGNLEPGDELLIADDGSTDETPRILAELATAHPEIRLLRHPRNLGGGAARNTCVRHARHALLFCLDSDNLLAPGSVRPLMRFMKSRQADVAAFGELHYFMDDPAHVSHASTFKTDPVTLADCLSEPLVPGSSGNYLFTRESWIRAGGYPETARALDAWGFGLRQVATGARMLAMPGSHYHHRIGHASYYVREARRNDTSHLATRLLLPFLDLIEPEDVSYLLGDMGRELWFSQLEERPVRVVPAALDSAGLRARACRRAPDRMATLLEERLVDPLSLAPLSAFGDRLWSECESYPCMDGVPRLADPAPLPADTSGRWLQGYVATASLQDLPTVVQLGDAPQVGIETPYAYVVAGTPKGPNSEEAPPHQVAAKPEALPFAAGSVDLVLSAGTLERTQNPLKVLLEIHRVLKEDGLCLLETSLAASPLDPAVSAVLDEAFVSWYLEPLFDVLTIEALADGGGIALRKRAGGRLWITDGQLQELDDRLSCYRRARALEAEGDAAGSRALYRMIAVSEGMLPSEAPRRVYSLLQVAAPEAAEALRDALAVVGGPVIAELIGERQAGGKSLQELRPGLEVPGVADAGVVLGLLAQVAQASGREELANELAEWSVAV